MTGGLPRRPGAAAGQSLIGALAALALLSLLLAASTLAVRRQVARQAPLAAAERFASELRARRWEAIARARGLGLVFERSAAGDWFVSVHEDGDGDGIRAEDRASGRDPRIAGPWRFEQRFGALGPGFRAGLAQLRSPPPALRLLPDLEDPVRFGRGDVVSLSPRGRTSSGTLYLTDGTERQWAVTIVGSTGRVRVWEYLDEEQGWRRRSH